MMTIAEVKRGNPFEYRGNQYQIKGDDYDGWYLMRYDLNLYVGNIKEFNGRVVKVYAYLMDKRVVKNFHLKECFGLK